jgi:carotenoid cleavage dioxygenase-like enzyme
MQAAPDNLSDCVNTQDDPRNTTQSPLPNLDNLTVGSQGPQARSAQADWDGLSPGATDLEGAIDLEERGNLGEQLRPSHCFPQAAMLASRIQWSNPSLIVLAGQLPADLTGHCLIMGPAGDDTMLALPGEPFLHPSSGGVSRFNGDAMVHRLDFGEGQAQVTSRLLKTPCFYADAATAPGSPYADLKFSSSGLGRFSPWLGFRNQINTACIPVKFAGDDHWRLLAAWDAGRPYEIDPQTLEVITPIGANSEWRPQSLPVAQGPFPIVCTATHHLFDDRTQELFTVNWGKSSATMVGPLVLYGLVQLGRQHPLMMGLAKLVLGGLVGLGRWIQRLHPAKVSDDFVNLIRWDGGDRLQRWQLRLPNGSPLRIHQSMHQVAASQDYLVLMDTAFKLGPEQLIPNPLPGHAQAEVHLRQLLDYPQLADTPVYLVKRADLDPADDSVTAQPVTIPREIAHFRVDYDDSQGVVIHVAHNNGWDSAESLQRYDRLANLGAETGAGADSGPDANHDSRGATKNVGMATTTTDLNLLGRYVIDPAKGLVVACELLRDRNLTWSPALYADNGTLALPDRYDNLYWNAWGCWDNLLSEFVCDLYKDHKYREMDLETVRRFAQEGVPSNLCRLDTQSMKIVDHYCFPLGTFGNSPQFIPRPIPRSSGDGRSGQVRDTDGYLVTVVVFDDAQGQPQSQIWIFDGQDLAQGPICQLGDPSGQFQMGLTIHTTWIPELGPRQAIYHVPVRADFEPLLVNQPAIVRELFEQQIYPHFEVSSPANANP